MSANNYSISQVLQDVVDESTHPNEEPAVTLSVPGPPNALISFSDRDEIPLPQVFQRPSLDKKGAKLRYLHTLLNEVQNVRLDLAV